MLYDISKFEAPSKKMLLCYIFDNKSHGKANLDFSGVEEIPLDGTDPPLHPRYTEGEGHLEAHAFHFEILRPGGWYETCH